MLSDRGFNEIKLMVRTMEEIEECTKRNTPVILADDAPNETQAHVYICNDEKVGVKHLRLWCEQSPISTHIIIVSVDGPTSFTKKEAEACNHTINFFLFRQLSINITRHALVPRHKKIQCLPKINGFEIDKNDLPRLSVNDKISLYYAFQPGDIIEITRCCGTQQPHKYWRMVVHAIDA